MGTDVKREELRTLIAGALEPSIGDEAVLAAGEVVDHFASVTPPQLKLPPVDANVQLIRIGMGGLGGGTSIKPGNVVLNWRKLVVAIASGTLTIGAAMAAPWTLILGAIVTWNSLYSCLQLEITDTHASVLWGLWNNRDERNTVAKQEVSEAVNGERRSFGRQPLSPQEIDVALGDLTRMRCIRESADDRCRWWLREWARCPYY